MKTKTSAIDKQFLCHIFSDSYKAKEIEGNSKEEKVYYTYFLTNFL